MADLQIIIDGKDLEHPANDDRTVDVTITTDETPSQCVNCGQQVAHYATNRLVEDFAQGWVHADNRIGDNRLCQLGPAVGMDTDELYELLEVDQDSVILVSDLEDADVRWAQPNVNDPGNYVNWVGATVNEDHVEVQISVGDSRGCFAMRVWQGLDDEGNPRVYLSVPNPSDPAPHMKLTRHTDSTFVVG